MEVRFDVRELLLMIHQPNNKYITLTLFFAGFHVIQRKYPECSGQKPHKVKCIYEPVRIFSLILRPNKLLWCLSILVGAAVPADIKSVLEFFLAVWAADIHGYVP